jgi:hypothetical protein
MPPHLNYGLTITTEQTMQGFKLAAVIAAISLAGTTTQAQAQSYMVPGSDSKDFSIRCEKEGKITLNIQDRSGVDQMQVARFIYVTDQGGGRTLLTFKRGFTSANEDGSHLTATNETCSFLEK